MSLRRLGAADEAAYLRTSDRETTTRITRICRTLSNIHADASPEADSRNARVVGSNEGRLPRVTREDAADANVARLAAG